jgi:NAD(P)-dependent dehydrogenase (short-subunit alcohol dehydrogenase family)
MLSGKTVFISGGTGKIGESICRVFASYGAKVIFSYSKNSERAKIIEDEIPGSRSVVINVLDIKDIDAKISALYKEIETIDILVNNAGVSQIMPFSLMEEEDFDLTMDVNVKGTFFLTKAVARRMIKNRKGCIISIGSIAGHRMYDVPVHYAISKAAINGLTFALANELKKFNIRVNSIVPGMIEGGVSDGIPEELQKDFLAHCAAGRAGSSDEVAELAAFIASDKAPYINGQNILIDGGI